MALVNFYKGLSTEYNQGTHANSIFACTDTRDVYFFGIKQHGLTDDQYDKIAQIGDQELPVGYSPITSGYPTAGDNLIDAIKKLHGKLQEVEEALNLKDESGSSELG